MAESFWTIPNVEKVRVPILIMREQASELTRLTNGSLRGYVESQKLGDELYLKFHIIVPALDNYTIELFSYEQPMQIYPGVLESNVHKQRIRIDDIQQFSSTLRDMLSSDDTQRVLTALLAQTKSE
jgi:hypothetical protein